MKSSPSSRRGRASRQADLLVELSEGLAHSGSRVEDIFWKTKLDDEIQRNLLESDENSLTTAARFWWKFARKLSNTRRLHVLNSIQIAVLDEDDFLKRSGTWNRFHLYTAFRTVDSTILAFEGP